VTKDATVGSDNMMQSNEMQFRHPQAPVSGRPLILLDRHQNIPLILRCEEWLAIGIFWVFDRLVFEFTPSVGALEQIHCCVPTCLDIHNG
jgi:hypothetical protein